MKEKKITPNKIGTQARTVVGHIISAFQKFIFSRYEYPKIKQQYGDFRLDRDYSKQHITGLLKESGVIRGVIVEIVNKLLPRIDRALLPGEYNRDKLYYSKFLDIDPKQIVTAGIGGDMDYEWNYEAEPPEMGKFDIIISQAMLEHLLNPYKHVTDLCSLLNRGGILILHTHIPGFRYHRHPIDCMRFYPDWFEQVAKRLDLTVYDRYIGHFRICYTLKKEK